MIKGAINNKVEEVHEAIDCQFEKSDWSGMDLSRKNMRKQEAEAREELNNFKEAIRVMKQANMEGKTLIEVVDWENSIKELEMELPLKEHFLELLNQNIKGLDSICKEIEEAYGL